MVVTPVDQRYLDIGSLERLCCRNAGETAADDQDAFFAANRIRDDWLFLRKAFCEDCAHLFARPVPRHPPQYWIQLRAELFLNGDAVRRTSVRVHAGVGTKRSNRGPHSRGWRPTLIVDLNCGGHAGRKDDIGRHLIDMDANRDALGQAYPGEDGIDGSNPLTVWPRVRNVDCAPGLAGLWLARDPPPSHW
jgi:hypothetical protein